MPNRPTRRLPLALALAFFGLVSSPVYAWESILEPPDMSELPTTVSDNQITTEDLRRRATDAMNRKDWRLAEISWFRVLSRKDAEGYLAESAASELKTTIRSMGVFEEAKAKYADLKERGKVPESWPIAKDERIQTLSSTIELAKKLSRLFKLGGLLAARTAVVGAIFAELGLADPAEFFFSQAEEVAKKIQDDTHRTRRRAVAFRPLSAWVPAETVSPQQTRFHVEQIAPPAFAYELRSDPDVVLDTPLDRPGYPLKLSIGLNWDSNVPGENGTSSPRVPSVLKKSTGGARRDLGLEFEAMTSPTAQIKWGLLARALREDFARSDMDAYESTDLSARAYGSWFAMQNLEARADLFGARTNHDISRKDLFTRRLGLSPSIAWRTSPAMRWDAKFEWVELSDKSDAGDPDFARTGRLYAGELEAFLERNRSAIHTSAAFRWERRIVHGRFAARNELSSEARVSRWIGTYSRIALTTRLARAMFPDNARRTDSIREAWIKTFLAANASFGFLVEGGYRQNSSSHIEFDFNEWGAGLGVRLTADI